MSACSAYYRFPYTAYTWPWCSLQFINSVKRAVLVLFLFPLSQLSSDLLALTSKRLNSKWGCCRRTLRWSYPLLVTSVIYKSSKKENCFHRCFCPPGEHLSTIVVVVKICIVLSVSLTPLASAFRLCVTSSWPGSWCHAPLMEASQCGTWTRREKRFESWASFLCVHCFSIRLLLSVVKSLVAPLYFHLSPCVNARVSLCV